MSILVLAISLELSNLETTFVEVVYFSQLYWW